MRSYRQKGCALMSMQMCAYERALMSDARLLPTPSRQAGKSLSSDRSANPTR